ncbi:MAG TPA: hypothetical protein VGY99_20385 [Candidatus Binataceae bacterium]|jgi:hypothetical protein|nr:hypothetical protein [Candidatus Binataceae bacterium]
MKYNVISADSHINEPPGTWVDRVPAKFKDVAPRVVPTADGGEGWKFPDELQAHSFGLVSAALQKGEIRGPERYIPTGLKFDEIARGSWDPKQHIEDMKTDGCDASILYFGVAAGIYNMKDRELRLACFRAFNDWLGEFCSYDPARLVGPPLLPVEEESIQDAIDELHRNARQWNIRGAQIPIFSLEALSRQILRSPMGGGAGDGSVAGVPSGSESSLCFWRSPIRAGPGWPTRSCVISPTRCRLPTWSSAAFSIGSLN